MTSVRLEPHASPGTGARSDARPAPARDDTSGRRAALAAAAWTAVVTVAVAWGATRVAPAGVSLRAAPLMGHWDWRGARGLVPAAAVGAAVAWWGPRMAARLTWRPLVAAAATATAAWTVALAAADGWAQVTRPLTTRHEYEPLAARVDDLGAFVSTYVADLSTRPIHVQGHPPGPVAVAWALDAVGLSGAGWLAALAIGAWGGTVAAALAALRAVGGEAAARRAAPALVVLPAAVWAGTSLDALFAAVVALAVALGAVAGTRGSVAGGVAAGTAFGGGLLLTYGAVPLVVVVAAGIVGGATAAAGSRRARLRRAAVVAGPAALATGAVLVAAGAAGFWWPDGLEATRRAYWSGVATSRPWAYLTFMGNPAALALAVGPAVAVGLARLRAPGHHRPAVRGSAAGRAAAGGRAWVLSGAALVAVGAADLSQHARGEVERIWLPFVPWLALAAPGDHRRWLAVQVAVALALQAALRSPW